MKKSAALSRTQKHRTLAIAGPGIPAGSSTSAIAENIDLATTFAQLGGTTMPGDGHSLIALFHGGLPAGWRDAALIEHDGQVTSAPNPDQQTRITGNPPSYEAIRTQHFLYVEYQNGQRELYDLHTDPYELDNIINPVNPATRSLLHDKLTALQNCHSGNTCWTAEHIDAIRVNLTHRHIRRRRS